jgi:hypothetical protein
MTFKVSHAEWGISYAAVKVSLYRALIDVCSSSSYLINKKEVKIKT